MAGSAPFEERPGDRGRRDAMVRSQIEARGVRDPAVLAAMRKVPREAFLGGGRRADAYLDAALPIDCGQTISQPYVVAAMTEALAVGPAARVLEIGTGSGYAAAVLAEIAAEVYTVERLPRLADQASERLRRLGYANVRVRCADGSLGWPEKAPFDGILVSAGAPSVPPSLKRQLSVGGRLVLPVGRTRYGQELLAVKRTAEEAWDEERLGGVRFVPLVGEEGWPLDDDGY